MFSASALGIASALTARRLDFELPTPGERAGSLRLLNLGELNTTQIDRWQRSIEVIEEDGRACQRRLFSDREGKAPRQEEDVCEVVLSSLSVRRPRILGDCWLGCRLWGSWAWISFGLQPSGIGAERWNGPR